MVYILAATIPSKVNLYLCKDSETGWYWDNYHIREVQNKLAPIGKVATWAFPAPSNNSGMCKTANKSATDKLCRDGDRKNFPNQPVSYDAELKPYPAETAEMVQVENLPMSGLRLVGTRPGVRDAVDFLVELPGGYVVPMTHDILMDGLLGGGVEEGAVFKGNYIFVLANGSMHLVRVGSAFHEAAKVADERSKISKIKPLEMNPGRVYKNKHGHIAALVGFVNTVNYTVKFTELQKKLLDSRGGYSNNVFDVLPTEEQLQDLEKVEVSTNEWKLSPIWFTGCYRLMYGKDGSANGDFTADAVAATQKDLNNVVNRGQSYSLSLLKTHSYIEEIPGVEMDTPLDFYSPMRREVAKKISDTVAKFTAHSPRNENEIAQYMGSTFGYGTASPEHKALASRLTKIKTLLHLKKTLAEYATLANMQIYGMTPIINADIEKYLGKPSGQ